MKNYLLLSLLGLSFLCEAQNLSTLPSTPNQAIFTKEKVSIVQVFIDDHEQLHDLDALDIGADHIHFDEDGAVELYLTQTRIKKLAKHGFRYEIKIEDYDAFFRDRAAREAPYVNSFEKMRRTASNFGYGSMGGFYTYDEMVDKLDEMETLYPDIVKAKYSIGTSNEGRTIWALKISDNPDIDESEPVVYYDAVHHAREPLSMAVTINYMFWLLENYTTDPNVEYIVNNRELYFVPIVNPDGYVYNQTTNPNGGGLWRKNRRANTDGTFGVDLNRNYSHAYDYDSNCSSNTPNSSTYSGTGSFSEPETQAVRDFVEEIDPTVAFSSHSTAGKYLMPYGFDTAPPEFSTYSEWASDFLADNNYPYGVTYQMLGYTSCGTTRDYLHNEGIYGWTPEIGGSGFWPAQSEIFGRVDENVGPLFYQAWICGGFADFQSHTTTGEAVAGGSFTMSVELKNKGVGEDASNLEVSLEPSNPLVTVSAEQSFPDVAQQSKANNSATPFTINLDPAFSDGTVSIDIVITQDGVESSRETVTLFVGTKTNLYNDDAESGAANWTASGNGISWGVIQDDSYGGTNSFGDSDGGNCENNTSNYFTFNPVIDLSSTDKPIVNFFSKWSLDINDNVQLQISTNGGANYSTIKTYTFNSRWTQESINLSNYNGNANVKLRFFLTTNGDTNADGFYFDDFSIDDYDCPVCPLCDVFVDDFPAEESFESGTGEWSQVSDGSDDLDWIEQSGPTASADTGPAAAADGSVYLYVEASTPNNPTKTAIIESPCYDFRSSISAALDFQYHMYGTTVDMQLEAEVSIDKGNTWTNLGFTIIGNQGNQWNLQNIDLSAYIGEMVNLRFIGTTGESWQGDVSIDDIEVTSEEPTCTEGDPCDDNDTCTTGEIFDANCDCNGGTIPDADSDGVCDADDVCPGFDDNLIGTLCNDNDECTTGDVYTTNCLCEGTESGDSDSDGICDPIDECPGFDDTLNGTTCNDNNPCTDNDTYIDCLCLGTPSGDDDNDGVCNNEDVCPSFNDALIGTPCEDGDVCTTGETYDANCGCTGGTFQDTDSDGVCDADDQCPDFNDALIGTSCDDGDTCTENDIYSENCDCTGTPVNDSDNDGICDANDICPGFDDTLIGTVCDDGDDCTTGEIYDVNCGCSGGIFQDADSDGVCDTNDQCPNFNDALIGLSCDDGDDCTDNDIYGVDCGCAGTYSGDTDADGICDNLDQCPGFNDTLIGTSCDDGDDCTTGETYDANCGCTGGIFQDADSDGVCDVDDVCPSFDDALIGTSCDDGDECTTNDVYTSQCDCEGTNLPDSDNDGFCDAEDQCPDFDDALIGSSCDDGDDCTTGETYDANCGCSGGLFADNDNDGICNALDPCPDDAFDICNLPTYCAAQGNSTQYEHISQVTFNDLDNNSGDDSGYEDYTDQAASVQSGETYDITLVPGFASGAYSEHWGVWIDFNQDGDFDDTDENIVTASSNATITQSVTIPSGLVLTGGTRMRVSMKYNAAPTSCEAFSWGEVEDYTVLITAECTQGETCDDGDECTTGETYDANCGCTGGTFQDADSDGVCDANDQCPDFDDALIGSSCDDGDECTIGETYDANCGCSGGTFQDADGDGVCDADDDCPDFDNSLIGTSCDDGNDCTIGETYSANCGCIGGTFQDTDNDGVCDADDQCPDFDNALIGTPCDDGDDCTTGETYDANCGCSGGTIQDADNDGVCDADDQCPDFNDTLIGTTCDDGDNCTTGETYDANCGCTGGTFQDADSDGVCDANDACADFNDALLGTVCDDGIACTVNDIYVDCGCTGTLDGDADNDGVCDVEDQCPGFNDALIGTTCDDGDDCTAGETYDANCGCTGGTFQDADNDGVCDADDACADFNDALLGTACDDNDPCTDNDIYVDCACVGTYSGDDDSDGVCNNEDACPNFDDALIGSACDDNDPCTENDIYVDCGCAGIYSGDEDNDGVCNTIDQCPDFDNALIGTPCDDGDDCTNGETFDANCGCSGGTIQDADNDGVCDADDQCPDFNDALIGTTCDDGDDCTTGETYDANCGCTGGTFQDADSDGVCDADDACADFNDALLGTACDDGIACTVNDIYVDCDCIGTLDGDADSDGVCDVEDQCPGFNDALIGTTCDDGDDCTTGETYDANCGCSGGTFQDADSDGVCDANDACADFDDALLGTACDDGIACTVNDIYVDCGCTGTLDGDTDNDGVCDIEDQCPDFNDALIGTSCDDGDDCTTGETYDANCGCTGGTFQDTDNDGVCDADDACADFNDLLLGTTCDDNDPCTDNDIYVDCACVGTYSGDDDSDGVCNNEDACPDFDDVLIGTPCDDNDPCTDNDIYVDCGCAGIYSGDEDNDGVCNTIDQCPDFDNASIGTPCDDGDDCTNGETYDANCGCSGGTIQDADNDGVCDADDQCPGFNDALIGTTCDDGDDCTTGETYDANCGCTGGTFQDADSDGVCDIDDTCPGLDNTLIGTPCDDGNACTIGETYDINCGCSGGVLEDTDNDGICNADDLCPDFDNSLIGTSCDDGDACTTGEIYDANCGCSGGIIEDEDNDGVCDADDECPGKDDTEDVNNDGFIDGCAACPFYNWNNESVLSYDSGQDFGPYDIQDGGNTLFMDGNAWKAIDINYNVTANTVIQFDFKSTIEGEIHEIGFDNDLIVAPDHRIVVYGDQGYSGTFNNATYTGTGDWQTFNISLGANFTGLFQYLVLTADDDAASAGNSYYRNVKIFEDLDGDLICDQECEEGESCEDGNPCTINTVYDSECNCGGGEDLPDTDGDGTCDDIDICPGFNDNLIGANCDDGDDCTVGETYDSNCGCSGGIYVDNDNDGYCISEDPNDSDGCIPDENSATCSNCETVDFDDMESGFGFWNDGGSDCSWDTGFGENGSRSMRIRDNSGSASSLYSDAINMSSYLSVNISFTYFPVSMENNEDFFLEYSLNGGQSYTIAAEWNRGTEFENNIRYYEAVDFDGIEFSSNTVFRFRCDASGNADKIYIDDVLIEGCYTLEGYQQSQNTELRDRSNRVINLCAISLYPNPAKEKLFLDTKKMFDADEKLFLTIYGMDGKATINKTIDAADIIEIDLRDLSRSQQYFLKLTTFEGETFTHRFMKID